MICIIEHPTRGVLTDMPHERDDKPHFSWSIMRNDERVRQFPNRAKALAALASLPDDCYVLERHNAWMRVSC